VRSDDTFLSSSTDGTVKLWSLSDDGRPIEMTPNWSIPSDKRWIWSVAYGQDPNMVFSGDNNGRVRAWVSGAANLARIACTCVTRDLSDQEWQRFAPGDVKYQACRAPTE